MPVATVATVRLEFTDPRLVFKAKKALDQKKAVEVVLVGEKAAVGGPILTRLLTAGQSATFAVDPITVGAILAAIGLAVIGTICIVGMSLGYKIDIDHDANSVSPFDDKLSIRLVPPQN